MSSATACAPWRRQWWTRLRAIRTVGELWVELSVAAHEPFMFQVIEPEARRMRRLGMTWRAIGAALGVDEGTVRNALARATRGGSGRR